MVRACAALSLCLSGCGTGPPGVCPAVASWTVETVDGAGDIGVSPALAIGSDGTVYVAYWDVANADLRFATNAGGSWVAQTVDAEGDTGRDPAIALDASGAAHVSYWSATTGDLRYATNETGAWSTETIDSEEFGVGDSSIAVDAEGRVQVAYVVYPCESCDWGSRYAIRRDGSWETEGIGWWASMTTNDWLALDSRGAHVALSETPMVLEVPGGLFFETHTADGWVKESLLDAPASSVSLAIDPTGKRHLSFWRGPLEYIAGDSEPEVVADVSVPEPRGIAASSLAVERSGTPHIAFHDLGARALRYATRRSGRWVTTVVDEAGDVGLEPSIAIRGCAIGIAYYDAENGDLKYAHP